MSLSIKFLGTSASRPTVERGVSSIAITREGETMLIDCGEGTQRQMMRYGVSFALGDIFFTHFHTDHFIGILGLLRTLTLQARTEPIRIWGPKGCLAMMKRMDGLGTERLSFPMEVFEVTPGTPIARGGSAILRARREQEEEHETRAHRPFHRGGRFSANARSPSSRSSLASAFS